jgi:hypothetical protein
MLMGGALLLTFLPPLCILSVAIPRRLAVRWFDVHPLLVLLAAFALLAAGQALHAWVRLRADERAVSHCRRCGYDLSGNPSSQVCPECSQPRHDAADASS